MGKKKVDTEHPFKHGEVINYTLDCVPIYPVTTKIWVSFITQLTERKETLRDFTMMPINRHGVQWL
jgi:tRNA nucleotidyltransferase (CCA-adding enzyme)